MDTNATLDLIRKHLALGLELPAPDSTFGDLGADSLDVVEIALAIEMELGISTSDFDDWHFDTTMATVVADVAAVASKQQAAA